MAIVGESNRPAADGRKPSFSLGTFIRAVRAPFFTGTLVPVLLGTVIAWREGSFHLGYFLLALLGTLAIHAGLDVSNDYFDHRSGLDERNQELTPFSGGSRVIQEGILTPEAMLRLFVACFVLTIGIGLYLSVVRGWPILVIGMLGVFLAFFHNAPPIKLYYRGLGLGEVAVFIGFGPLEVLGAYYVQAQRLSWEALWASIPVGMLIAAVLYINEFPDYQADKAAGKRTAAVLLGRERAVWGYIALMAGTYGAIILGVALSILPYTTLLALLTTPLAYKGIEGARLYHSDTPRLIPTNAATIQVHLLTGLLLSLAYAIAIALGKRFIL